MNKKIRWITETAVMLALLICLQWAGSFIPHQMTKQLITGTCVNAVLAITVLFAGTYSGITVAVISPVCAFLLGIAPNFITVLPIMLGNTCYVLLLKLLAGRYYAKFHWRQVVALICAAAAKFAVLYILVVVVICGFASDALLGKKLGDIVVLAPPMLKMLPTMFAWPQLITALCGGTLALLVAPSLRKALHK